MTAPTFFDPRLLTTNIQSTDLFMRIIPAANNTEGVYCYTISTEFTIDGPFVTIRFFDVTLTEITTVDFQSEAFDRFYRALARPNGGLYIVGTTPVSGDGEVNVRSLDPDGTLGAPSTIVNAGTPGFSNMNALCLPDDSLIVTAAQDGLTQLLRVESGIVVETASIEPTEFTFPPTFDQHSPLQGTVLTTGNVVVSWIKRVAVGPDAFRAYYAIYDPSDLSLLYGPFAVDDGVPNSNIDGVFVTVGGFMIQGVRTDLEELSFGRRCNNVGMPLSADFDTDRIGDLLLINRDYTLWYATEGNRLRKYGPNRNADGLLAFPRSIIEVLPARDDKMLVLTRAVAVGEGAPDAEWVIEAINPGAGNDPPAKVMAVRVG